VLVKRGERNPGRVLDRGGAFAAWRENKGGHRCTLLGEEKLAGGRVIGGGGGGERKREVVIISTISERGVGERKRKGGNARPFLVPGARTIWRSGRGEEKGRGKKGEREATSSLSRDRGRVGEINDHWEEEIVDLVWKKSLPCDRVELTKKRGGGNERSMSPVGDQTS